MRPDLVVVARVGHPAGIRIDDVWLAAMRRGAGMSRSQAKWDGSYFNLEAPFCLSGPGQLAEAALRPLIASFSSREK